MNKLEQAARQALEALNAELEAGTCEEFEDAAEKCYEAIAALQEALSEQALQKLSDFHQSIEEPKCNQHPDAPHGFDRNASHNAGRYVCECEGWSTADMAYRPGGLSMDKEQEPFDMNDHPPHRLCECRKCMEYFTPLPDCDAFAASGKPITEQEPVGMVIGGIFEPWNDDVLSGAWELYAAPVRTKDSCNPLQDLTDDEILKIWQIQVPASSRVYAFARAVIAKDREKNNANNNT